MKVLLAINSLSTGGAEVFTAALARGLRRAGCEVLLYLYAGALDSKGQALLERLQGDGIRVITPNARRPWQKILAVAQLASLIRHFRPDVVHSHLEQTDFMVSVACVLAGEYRLRKIRTIHNVYAIKSLPAFVHRWLAGTFASTVACGQVVAREYPYMGAQARCIENGIELERASPASGLTLRRQLGIADDTMALVVIGSFDLRNGILQKAQDTVVDALALVKTADLVICFLGDGDQRAKVEHCARDNNVYDRCRFPGRVIDVPAYLAMADAVLMPSRFEGLPIGAIEAVCAGKPLIISDIDQLQPFLTPAVCVATVDDSVSLANAIDRMSEQRHAFLAHAQACVHDFSLRFDIDASSQKYLDLYRSANATGAMQGH